MIEVRRGSGEQEISGFLTPISFYEKPESLK
jgi:hypothetical protein